MRVGAWPCYLPPPPPPFSSKLTGGGGGGGVRGDGRDHYITKHPAAIVLRRRCHTTLPRRSPQTSGQVLCAAGREREKTRSEKRRTSWQKDRGMMKRGNERITKWGKDERKINKRRYPSVPRVHMTILMRKCLTFVFPWARWCLPGHRKIARSQRLGQNGGCQTGHCHLRDFFYDHRDLAFKCSCDDQESPPLPPTWRFFVVYTWPHLSCLHAFE